MKNFLLDHVAGTICAVAAMGAVGLAMILVTLVRIENNN